MGEFRGLLAYGRTILRWGAAQINPDSVRALDPRVDRVRQPRRSCSPSPNAVNPAGAIPDPRVAESLFYRGPS